MWLCRLRVAELQQLGNDVELCTGVTQFPSAELATAPERMAGWPASVGKRSPYEGPVWKYREAAPSPARRTDRDRAELRHGSGVAVRARRRWSLRPVCCQ